jgi:hypothetical protein
MGAAPRSSGYSHEPHLRLQPHRQAGQPEITDTEGITGSNPVSPTSAIPGHSHFLETLPSRRAGYVESRRAEKPAAELVGHIGRPRFASVALAGASTEASRPRPDSPAPRWPRASSPNHLTTRSPSSSSNPMACRPSSGSPGHCSRQSLIRDASLTLRPPSRSCSHSRTLCWPAPRKATAMSPRLV